MTPNGAVSSNPFVLVTSPSNVTRAHTPTGTYLVPPPQAKSRATTPNRLSPAPREKSPAINRTVKTAPVSTDSALPRIGTELRPFMYKEKFDTLMSNFSKAVTITDISEEEWKRITQSDSSLLTDIPEVQIQEPPVSGRL